MQKTLLLTIDFPPQIGGGAKYQFYLAKYLDSKNLVVLTPKAPVSYATDLKSEYSIHRHRLITEHGVMWPHWWRMVYWTYRLIKQDKIEKIWAAQPLPCGTVAWLMKKWLKIPYVINLHGTEILMASRSWRKKWLLRKILNQADYITANCEFTKNLALDLGVKPAEKIKIIYPCPSIDNFSEEELAPLRKKFIADNNLDNKKILLHVGRVITRKGIGRVINALPKVLEKCPDWVYVVVGEGKDRKLFEKMVRKNKLESSVKFIGRQEGKDLAAWFSLADIYIMISEVEKKKDVESFGIVYLEANKFGKPIIAGDCGGVKEAVIHGETGLLVPPTDELALIEVMVRLMNDNDLRIKLGQQGQERVAKMFNWHTEAEKFKRLL